MIARIVVAIAIVAACGGKPQPTSSAPSVRHPATAAERVLAMLPDGAQIVVELDLARLRANPVVGAMVARAIAPWAAPARMPGGLDRLPDRLADHVGIADAVVIAAYGIGTSQAATVTVVVATTEVPEATRLADGIYALGPTEWIAQLEGRAALIANGNPIAAAPELLELRDRAMPDGAPGASLRVTARLPFDARIALARLTGLPGAPSRLSLWGDVVDDLAIIVDADAADPGERASKKSAARLIATIRAALSVVAGDPTARALGLSPSLTGAKLVAHGTWVRAILAVGPRRLQRVVERANALFSAPANPVESRSN